jgi:hypothetical protein
MRTAKLIALAGLILAVTGTAGALTHIPFRSTWPATGDPDSRAPIYCHVVDHSCGTVYLPFDLAGAPVAEGVWLDPAGLQSAPGLGLMPGEDSWGLFEIDLIRKGTFNSFGDIVPLGGDDILYAVGDQNTELVGIFENRVDIAVKFNPGGSFEIQAVGDTYKIYLQDFDLYDDGMAGSSGRNLVTGDYASVGTDASAQLVLDGFSQNSFYPDTGFGDPEVIAQFYPSGTNPGRTDAYIQLSDPGAGTDNERFDTDYFVGASETADFRLQATTTTNNGFNLSGAAWLAELGARWDASSQLQNAFPVKQDYIDAFASYDWTADSSDPLTSGVYPIPEPLTMVGAYLRKRRA